MEFAIWVNINLLIAVKDFSFFKIYNGIEGFP